MSCLPLISEDFDSCCLFFKVLGDPTRMKIILALQEGELCVSDLTEKLNMTQSAISHQLIVLKKAWIVKSRREGKNIFYSFEDEHVELIIKTAIEHITHKNK